MNVRALRWLPSLTLILQAAFSAEGTVSFNEQIRPILSDNCFSCHGTDATHRKKRRLDTPEGAYAARNEIRAIVPGDPDDSDLWLRITSTDEDEMMPPKDSNKPPLTKAQRDLIKRWIEEGAVYQKHWAFEPIARPANPPPPATATRGAGPETIDAFVLAKLAPRQLALSPEAPREILFRRLTLDLTGLPPTPAELDAFLADTAPDAYEKAVDRLLASPRYGEHFARYWLDAVRYADTHGLHFDNIRSIWPYRDWVVAAFNRNLPFNQFTIEQLAGDLLPNPTESQLIATGYLRSNLTTHEGGSITEELIARNTADRVNTTAAAWLGLTASCASCHDHKFDPLTQKEYYQLGAFFRGLEDRGWDGNVALPGPRILLGSPAQLAQLDRVAAELAAREEALADLTTKAAARVPMPKSSEPAMYEVVWADDGDAPTPEDFQTSPLERGWREGEAVPLVSGHRALRIEGPIQRDVFFGSGDVALKMHQALRAFVHVHLDPAKRPKALSIEFLLTERWSPRRTVTKKSRRLVWGDAAAVGPAGDDTVAVGSLPLAGNYFRLEADGALAGLKLDDAYTGIRISLSDGAAWCDNIGTVVESVAEKDPLLSQVAWRTSVRQDSGFDHVALPLEILDLLQAEKSTLSPAEQKRIQSWYRNYVFGPLRGALENKLHAARALIAEQVWIEKQLAGSLVARERAQPRESHVLLRGQYDQLGEPVQPDTPAFLPPLQRSASRATRLDLARWLVSAENPLVPRVVVNRFWQQLFGAGIVRTPEDFGTQGEPPGHRELLDWLARDFMDQGWNVKRLVRLLVTSRAYCQDSRCSPMLYEIDPANRLLGRASRFRLDAEIIRDQALVFGGLLVEQIGGAPVKPYQPDNVWEPVAFTGSNTRHYQRDTGAALYRRSLYTLWKRTAPPASLATFDAPSREAFCVVRQRSNTPLQALALMNDVQQFEAARTFAASVLARNEPEPARLAFAFRCVTARVPSPRERTLLADALNTQRARLAAHPAAAEKVLTNGDSPPPPHLPPGELAAWTLLVTLLFNLDEAINRN